MNAFEEIAYADGDTPLTGLALHPQGGARAAVTIFPTFMNSTPAVEAKARSLAAQGYAVLIGDFYGPDAPADMQQAFAAMTRLRADPVAARQRLRATVRLLRERHPDLPQLAIGFCLGGFAVLEMARDGQDLAAVASFHGMLETALPATKPIHPRILVCHGDADTLVPRSQVIDFWEEMDRVGADWHFHSYAGVEHGFTNPRTRDGAPNPAYDASADRQSWAAMLGLFDEVLDPQD
ncbi:MULTISPECIES: dienelactone hydrolase family protein [Citromicrobium]|uniref:dienelactone hydrolase family protein n=1 Tax=Citromicrobium TaxID=72173 RepID=UPI0001DD105F|nr:MULTISPECIES: dienelactone hydrolase family protein [Citromicrobium]ALG61095.1 dienelactone hydrolase [Citromicrobium sp. JL477]KPM15256.1 dienelactone hydrolase [Citromicrobium sp. JL1351]KPM19615.1 dienelactone hydrolase [Citromicrobium sp. JL31]KPM26326.1 dienelactone hydrolase [Citromicrobium sp. JL2201]